MSVRTGAGWREERWAFLLAFLLWTTGLLRRPGPQRKLLSQINNIWFFHSRSFYQKKKNYVHCQDLHSKPMISIFPRSRRNFVFLPRVLFCDKVLIFHLWGKRRKKKVSFVERQKTQRHAQFGNGEEEKWFPSHSLVHTVFFLYQKILNECLRERERAHFD